MKKIKFSKATIQILGHLSVLTYADQWKDLLTSTLSQSLFSTSTHCSPHPVFSFAGGKFTEWPRFFNSIKMLDMVALGSSYYREKDRRVHCSSELGLEAHTQDQADHRRHGNTQAIKEI